jgi:hypothetical protein
MRPLDILIVDDQIDAGGALKPLTAARRLFKPFEPVALLQATTGIERERGTDQ